MELLTNNGYDQRIVSIRPDWLEEQGQKLDRIIELLEIIADPPQHQDWYDQLNKITGHRMK